MFLLLSFPSHRATATDAQTGKSTASNSEFGKPAPDWSIRAEVYNGWYARWTDDVVQTRLKGFPLIDGVPHAKEWIDKAHRQGVRVIPYIGFYQDLNSTEVKKAGTESLVGEKGEDVWGFLKSPFWKELDLLVSA